MAFEVTADHPVAVLKMCALMFPIGEITTQAVNEADGLFE